MKTIQKILIVIGFSIPTITLALFWNLQCNNEIELMVAVSTVMYFMSWMSGKFTEAGCKEIK